MYFYTDTNDLSHAGFTTSAVMYWCVFIFTLNKRSYSLGLSCTSWYHIHHSSLSVCAAVLSNRLRIFLETCGARGDNWACSDVLNRSLNTMLQVTASPLFFSFVISNFLSIISVPLHFHWSHTHTEGEHQQLVFSLCFSKRAALILLDKGWESQENISTHTHTYTRVRKYATPPFVYTQTCATHTSVMDNTQPHICASGILP